MLQIAGVDQEGRLLTNAAGESAGPSEIEEIVEVGRVRDDQSLEIEVLKSLEQTLIAPRKVIQWLL